MLAGAAGLVATVGPDLRSPRTAASTIDVVDQLSQQSAHIGGSPGILTHLAILVMFLGLAVGRSTITR